MASKALPTPAIAADWRDFYALTKPRVMTLVIFTAICGLLAAPGSIHPVIGFTAILCISLGAAGSAALNQWYESDIDGQMKRTAARPIPSGRMDRAAALHFGIVLSVFSVLTMGLVVNVLSALILAFSIFFYAVAYTMWLKPSTPQNIVIGGAAGAFPPVIGWAAVTGDVTALPILMFLLIFIWTPPHFWALAMFVKLDYAKVGIPMMPVVAGERATRLQIFGYSVLLLIVAVAPWAMGLTGMVYGIPALVLTGLFLALATKVGFRMETDPRKMQPEKQLFAYSIIYLFVIFGFLAADRVLAGMA